ncbi:MAG: cation-translocating P-type ATPase family protein, partial [Planctomycetes bacterium]|nr:cation-translocating P-type ATPase family protein [Planctomycetota bacterium]
TVAFDKTGTLTPGRPTVTGIHPAEGIDEAAVLARAAAVEAGSEHTLARAILEAARARGIAPPPASSSRAVPGRGVEATVAGAEVCAGNRAFAESRGVTIPQHLASALDASEAAGATAVIVAEAGRALGLIAIGESPRAEARDAIARLRELGVRKVALLSGDNRRAADRVVADLGIDEARAELLPHEKVDAVRTLRAGGGRLAFVGDGINDAPSLAAADLGIAMGGDVRAELSVEAADAVLLDDDLRRLPDLLRWSRRAVRTIWQSIIAFAVIYNAAGIVLAATGIISPLAGAVVHQVGSLLVVLNALRIRFSGRWHETRIGRRAIEAARRLARIRAALAPRAARRWIAAHRRAASSLAIAAGAILWLGGGIRIVPPGSAGVVTRFGRMRSETLGPGLAVRLPWPFERVRIVPRERVRRVEIGFRSRGEDAAASPVLEIYEWGTAHAGIRTVPEESRGLTGDQDFIETKLVIHFAVVDPRAFVLQLGDPAAADALVRAQGEAALRRVLASLPFASILGEGRRGAEEAIARLISESPAIRAAGIGAVRAWLLDTHPPADVVPSFRDVASALLDKDRSVNRGEAYRTQATARARGDAMAEGIAAGAYRVTEVAGATGGAERFLSTLEGYRGSPAVAGLRMFLEAVEEGLASARKVILDPKAQGRRAVWFRGAEIVPAVASEPPPEAAGGEAER